MLNFLLVYSLLKCLSFAWILVSFMWFTMPCFYLFLWYVVTVTGLCSDVSKEHNLHCANNLVLGCEENIQTVLSSVQIYTSFISVRSSGFRALQLKCSVAMLHQLPFGCLGLSVFSMEHEAYAWPSYWLSLWATLNFRNSRYCFSLWNNFGLREISVKVHMLLCL